MKTIETTIYIPDNVARRFETCRKAGLSPDELNDILRLQVRYGKSASRVYSIWLDEMGFEKKMVLEMLAGDVSDYVHERMPNTPFEEALRQIEVPMRQFAEERMKRGGSKHYGSVELLLQNFYRLHGGIYGKEKKEGGVQ